MDYPEKKVCPDCYNDLPLSEYQLSTSGYYRRSCKSCQKIKHDLRKQLNPYKYKDLHRTSMFKRKYGITIGDYNNLFVQQSGKCAICKVHQSDLESPLCVDHSHTDNTIRGLLCSKCNLGIGHFNDNPNLLINAASYLGLKTEDN